jgi:hypothetical protein
LVFITRRKGFKKLFENAFGILEKEKKMEIFSLLNFWPEGLFPLLLSRPVLHLLAHFVTRPHQPSCSSSWPRAAQRAGPANKPQARLALLLSCLAATPGPLVGIVILLLVTE